MVTARYVPLEEVEDRLGRGWMVAPPTVPHPVLDSYRVLMVKMCQCDEPQVVS
jgi:hypothetical protein